MFKLASVLVLQILSVAPAPSDLFAQEVSSRDSRATLADPPFSGTIFIDPDIILPTDPTTFDSLTYIGQGMRTMFDRRVNAWITVNAYLFDARFDDGLSAEIQVNPEFDNPDAAQVEAEKYAPVIGRLPTALRTDLETVWIHKGVQPFGGGNNNLLIHTGQAALYDTDGILEETLVHEASHTSLDGPHAASANWLAAQAADGEFISTYARDNPNREDIAESFLPYLAVRYRSDRISMQLASTISQTIPNRMTYFDDQGFDMYPLVPNSVANEVDGSPVTGFFLEASYPNPFNPGVTQTRIEYRLDETSSVDLTVFDLTGRRVATLFSGIRQAGSHTASWHGVDSMGHSVRAGVYVYRLEVGHFVAAQTMILMR